MVVGLDLGYAGVYYDGTSDHAPAITLTTTEASVRAGDLVRLVAAASDDYGVESVSFYDIAPNGQGHLLRTLYGPPWVLDVQTLASPNGEARFMARATDGQGQFADSRVVSVTVLP